MIHFHDGDIYNTKQGLNLYSRKAWRHSVGGMLRIGKFVVRLRYSTRRRKLHFNVFLAGPPFSFGPEPLPGFLEEHASLKARDKTLPPNWKRPA